MLGSFVSSTLGVEIFIVLPLRDGNQISAGLWEWERLC